MLTNKAKLLLILSFELAVQHSSFEEIASIGPTEFVNCSVISIEINKDVLCNITENRQEAEQFMAGVMGLNG